MENDLLNKLYEILSKGWDTEVEEQATKLFTRYCNMENLDIDSREPDEILSAIYWLTELENHLKYDDFAHIMCRKLVA